MQMHRLGSALLGSNGSQEEALLDETVKSPSTAQSYACLLTSPSHWIQWDVQSNPNTLGPTQAVCIGPEPFLSAVKHMFKNCWADAVSCHYQLINWSCTGWVWPGWGHFWVAGGRRNGVGEAVPMGGVTWGGGRSLDASKPPSPAAPIQAAVACLDLRLLNSRYRSDQPHVYLGWLAPTVE